jgi:sigma-B regulation protein RsbU (phosphoserine phosphatase)
MKEQFLLQPNETTAHKFWKTWKWIGLAVYAIALIFGQYLPGTFVTAASIYGIIVIALLIFSGVRYLKDRLFWRVRNRLIGSFVFVGIIPLLLILGVIFLTAYILFGQLAGQYLNSAIQENERLLSDINAELAGHLASANPADVFRTEAVSVFTGHSAQFPHMAGRLVRRLPNGTLSVVSKYDPHAILRDISPHPGDKWRGKAESFLGVLEDGSKVVLASFRPIPAAAGFYIETEAPLDRSLEDRLRLEKSLYVISPRIRTPTLPPAATGSR